MNLLKRLKNKRPTDTVEVSKCFQRCFANSDGEKILNYGSRLEQPLFYKGFLLISFNNNL